MRAFIILLLLSSCGYRFGSQNFTSATVSVPYVAGDASGRFTDELVHALGSGSDFTYCSCPGTYRLEVALCTCKTTPIGFRYEQSDTGVLGKRLVASEARLFLTATVSLFDRSHKLVIPTFCVSEEVDVDFEPETAPQNQEAFSMGQLDFDNPAEAAGRISLYRHLARKVVNYLNAAF